MTTLQLPTLLPARVRAPAAGGPTHTTGGEAGGGVGARTGLGWRGTRTRPGPPISGRCITNVSWVKGPYTGRVPPLCRLCWGWWGQLVCLKSVWYRGTAAHQQHRPQSPGELRKSHLPPEGAAARERHRRARRRGLLRPLGSIAGTPTSSFCDGATRTGARAPVDTAQLEAGRSGGCCEHVSVIRRGCKAWQAGLAHPSNSEAKCESTACSQQQQVAWQEPSALQQLVHPSCELQAGEAQGGRQRTVPPHSRLSPGLP